MNINSITPQVYYLNKINKNNTPTFKSNIHDRRISPIGHSSTMHYGIEQPIVTLKQQLLKDGFSLDDIEKWNLSNTLDLKQGVNLAVLAKHVDKLEGAVTGKDIFNQTPKSINDIKAMLKCYKALKEKFATQQDVIEANKKGAELHRAFNKIFPDKKFEFDENATIKNGILHILSFTNAQNEPIAEALLDDNNFNNMYISSALIGLKNKENAKYGAQVLKMAQDTGYDKAFSSALSVLISEATEENMPLIEKIISTDQEFLSENSRFVAERLMSFLRFWTNTSLLYLLNDDITLNDINKLIDNEDSYDEE